jgi:Mannosyltransferase (PIG-V)
VPPWATFAAIRLGFVFFTALTLLFYPEHGEGLPQFHAWSRLSNLVFGTFEHWDADLFLRIAHDGYTDQLAAFMPVYPAAVHVLGPATGSALVAAVAISFTAATIGVAYVARLTADLLGDVAARDAAILIAIYPIAFVFTAPYSEGLFLVAAAAAAFYGTRGRFWLAGLLAGIAADTRLLGLALVPMLLVLAWPASRERGPRVFVPILLLPTLALGAVAAYFDRTLGKPFAFLDAQKDWGRHVLTLGPLTAAWRSARAAVHGAHALASVPTDTSTATRLADNVLDFGLLVGAIVLTVIAFRRLGAAWGIYSAFLIAIATAAPVTDGGEVLESFSRLLVCDFPLFIVGAALLQQAPARRGPVFGTLIAIAAVAGVAFSRKLWVA